MSLHLSCKGWLRWPVPLTGQLHGQAYLVTLHGSAGRHLSIWTVNCIGPVFVMVLQPFALVDERQRADAAQGLMLAA